MNIRILIILLLILLSLPTQAGEYTKRPIDWELFEAIEWGYDVEPLLKKGADPNAVAFANVNSVRKGDTPWVLALSRAKPEVITTLDKYRRSRDKLSADVQVGLFASAMGTTQQGNPNYTIDRVKLLLSYGLDVNAILLEEPKRNFRYGYDSQSPLMYAAASGKMDIVKLLLDKGADVNLRNKEGKNALSYAKNAEVTQLLLKAGANASVKGADGRTSLNEAILDGRSDLVAAILGAPSKPDIKILNQELLSACGVKGQTSNEKAHAASLEIVQMLIKAGANVNYNPPLEEHRGGPLVLAIYVNNAPVVKALLAAGADPRKAVNNDGGRSLLSLALQKGDPEIVKILWPSYQPLTEALTKELTQVAGSYGKPENVRMLTSLGFKLNAISKEAGEALYRAIDRGELSTVSVLLEQGVDPNQEVFSRNILAKAIQQGNIEIVRLLIAKGAKVNVDAKDPSQDTPLRASISTANLKVFQLLTEKGAKLVSEKLEHSLLHAIPWYGGYYGERTETEYKNSVLTILDALLKAGNNIDAPDYQGQSLLSKIAGQGFPELLKKVIDKGADVNFIPSQCKTATPSKLPVEPVAQKEDAGPEAKKSIAISPEQQLAYLCVTPLHSAISANNIGNIRLIIAAKANVNFASPYSGLTPLMMAAMNGNPEIVKLLLESGANIKMKNFAGQTAAEIAKIRENSRAQALIEKTP